MSLFIRIVELLIVITVVRTFFRMIVPAKPRSPSAPRRARTTERFDGKECDISDADYDEIK